MKINKKLIKKKKKNKKKQKKVITNNIQIVSEKISLILDQTDIQLIKNITSILGPKIALKICNQTADVEETGGINHPQLSSRRLSKLECFLYLIENDSDISQNKKNSIQDQKNGNASQPNVVEMNKKKRKHLKYKVKSVQNQLDRLCLNQIKNQRRHPIGNYFAIQNLNKLDDPNLKSSNENSYIKPSKFNLNLNDGVPSITPNFASSSLLSEPRLDLNQLKFGTNSLMNSNTNQFGCIQSNENPFANHFFGNHSNLPEAPQVNQFHQNNLTVINSQTIIKKEVNFNLNLNVNFNTNNPLESSVTTSSSDSVAGLFANSGENKRIM